MCPEKCARRPSPIPRPPRVYRGGSHPGSCDSGVQVSQCSRHLRFPGNLRPENFPSPPRPPQPSPTGARPQNRGRRTNATTNASTRNAYFENGVCHVHFPACGHTQAITSYSNLASHFAKSVSHVPFPASGHTSYATAYSTRPAHFVAGVRGVASRDGRARDGGGDGGGGGGDGDGGGGHGPGLGSPRGVDATTRESD